MVQIPTFVELDKTNIMSSRWKGNKFTWRLLQQRIDLRKTFWKSHALGAALSWFFSILTHVNLSKSKHYSVKTFEKTSIKFHVPSLPKWQKVLLIFKNIGLFITDEKVFNSLYQKIALWNNVLSQKFQARYFIEVRVKILQSEISCGNPVKYNV